jgi:hypothetical protein
MSANSQLRIANNNVVIVQSPEPSSPPQATLRVADLKNYFGTITIKRVESMPVVADEYASFRSLFGVWIERGDEDQQIKELYKSRLNPSAFVSE